MSATQDSLSQTQGGTSLLPFLIIKVAEYGVATTTPEVFIAVMDALGIYFQNVNLSTAEGVWICRRAESIISMCEKIIGKDWVSSVPECAAVLLLATQYSGKPSPDVQTCIQSFTLPC